MSVRNSSPRHAGLAAAIVLLGWLTGAPVAQAMQSPGAIRWGYPAENFVKSLYVAVLGRNPESPEVVAEWARQVDIHGKYWVFLQFRNSPEYLAKYGRDPIGGAATGSSGAGIGVGDCALWAGGCWTVYYRVNSNGSKSYKTSNGTMPNGYHGVPPGGGPYRNYTDAAAIMGYYQSLGN